jgi:metallo-beta-lactamase family protein
MKLTFQGAAGVVTGSMHLLESDGKRCLLDCGMFQGRRKEAEQRNREFPFPASSIDAVVLSHAHIDHSGRLPLIVKSGFHGPIYTTPATIDLCAAMLRDTGHIAESDAEFVNRKHPDDPPVEPLYNVEDAAATMQYFRPVPLHKPTNIGESILGENLAMESYDAGHILGSSSIVLTDGQTRLAFSGDVGRPGLPIIRDPEPLPPVDYLIMESTYGGRKHPQTSEAISQLEAIVKRTIGRGGRLIVPAFAVGRTQQLVLMLHQLINEKRIPSLPMFVDSPLAVNVTDVFRAHPECFNKETNEYLNNGEDPFGFKRLIYIRDVNESKKLNDRKGSFIVISASGMCEAGRILHHLRNNIGDSRNTVLLTGYQAENTLGRKLRDGWKTVRIFGISAQVEAEVAALEALSGHADAGELLDWMEPMAASLKKVFLVHGEPEQSAALAEAIHARYGLEAIPVMAGRSFDL